MKRNKILSLLLSVSMLTALTACGSQGSDTPAASTDAASTAAATESAASSDNGYVLDKVTLVVDGTFNASVDAYQDKFIEQWDVAVSEALGHPISLNIQQLDHSSYVDGVGRLFASGDYPDVILLNASQYAEYVKTGLLWDMTDAYDNAKFQSHMVLPAVNQSVRIDGRQYVVSLM